jgi:spore coat protein JC
VIASTVYKLLDGASPKDFENAGWGGQYAQHNHLNLWTDANGVHPIILPPLFYPV